MEVQNQLMEIAINSYPNVLLFILLIFFIKGKVKKIKAIIHKKYLQMQSSLDKNTEDIEALKNRNLGDLISEERGKKIKLKHHGRSNSTST